MKIIDVLRTGHVKRWHMVNVHRQQTIAEHMYLVTMIASDMARILGIENRDLIIQWALHHDLAEVMTGDIATPMKVALNREALGAVKTIENKVDLALRAFDEASNGFPRAIVKLADMVESIHFLDQELVNQTPADYGWQARVAIRIEFDNLLCTLRRNMPSIPWERLGDYVENLRQAMASQFDYSNSDPLTR
jgi:5'-deoxynucleotidase